MFPCNQNPDSLNQRQQQQTQTMNKLKKALIKFTNSNPTLFPNNNNNENSQMLIQQQFSQFFNVNTNTNFHTPNHPPYAAMIHKAIWELNEKGGSNEESISKYIKKEYTDLPWAHSSLLKHHLEKLCDREEISLTRKQRYRLAGAESVQISELESDNHLKRKRNSESGKKSDHRRKKTKKLKSEPDSESGKARSKHRNKLKSRPNSESGKESSRHRKKKKKSLLDIHETNKQKIVIFQEQDQVVEPLNEVADEQEKIMDNGMHEPQYLGIEYQSVERPSDKELTGICGNKKGEMKRRKRRKRGKLRYTTTKSSYKGSKKHKKVQLQVGKANLKQHNEVTDNESHEQSRIIEVNTCDIQFQEENEAGTSVAKRVNDTQFQELSDKQHNEVTDNELHEQNQIMEVNTCDVQFQEESEVGTSVAKVYKNDNSAKRVWTRSQLTAMSESDAIANSKLTAIRNHTPNDELNTLEYLYEEKQSSMEIIKVKKEKQSASPASTEKNGQRAKLRSSQKNTNVEEPTTATTLELTVSQDYKNMPKDKVDVGEYLSEEKELSCEIIGVKEAKQTPSQASSQVNRQRAKLRSSQKNTDHHEQTTTPIMTEAHEPSESQQYQQPEDSEDPPEENKPKHKGCGSLPQLKDPETNEVSSKTRSPANSIKSKLSAKMGKFEGKNPTANLFEDGESEKATPTNKKSQLNYVRHKMTRSGKMRDASC